MKKEQIPGFHQALTLFKKASRVPAYANLLRSWKVDLKQIQTYKAFSTLPIIDKKSYLYQYPFRDLFYEHRIPPVGYASSGSSGKPTFWFRGDPQEEMGGRIHETIFHDIFNIQKDERTLVVVCFAMGVWVAGNYTAASSRWVAERGYQITTITPGIDMGDIMNILKELAPQFTHLILVGYPSFIMDILHEAKRQGIRLNHKTNIITAGDKFNESWRNDVLQMLPKKDYCRSLVSIYGSADAAILGHETPLSIFLRREASKDKSFYTDLFGDVQKNLPGLVQYNPKEIFFEEIGGELILTAQTAAPLVRYNIHDIGRIIPYENIRTLLVKYNLFKKAKKYQLHKWRLPFLVMKGRSDVVVTFYALNIFPEHIQAGIQHKRVKKYLSGNFNAHNNTIHKSKDEKLYITVELLRGIRANTKILALVQKSVFENLIKLNIEYRKLYSVIGTRAIPKIILHEYNELHLSRQHGLLSIKGKKSKIVLRRKDD